MRPQFRRPQTPDEVGERLTKELRRKIPDDVWIGLCSEGWINELCDDDEEESEYKSAWNTLTRRLQWILPPRGSRRNHPVQGSAAPPSRTQWPLRPTER